MRTILTTATHGVISLMLMPDPAHTDGEKMALLEFAIITSDSASASHFGMSKILFSRSASSVLLVIKGIMAKM